jgi:hypothetical protein
MDSRPLKASRFLAFAALTAIAALAACGGGGSSGTAVPKAPVSTVTTPPASGAGLAPASFTIKIPSATSSSSSRRTKTVNAATTSISFTLLKSDAVGATVGGAPVSFDLSTTSTLCTTATGGARTCSISLAAPIGDDIYSVQTFDVTGAKLGSSAVNISVLQNVANSATISLGGQIAGVLMTLVTGTGSSFSNPAQLIATGTGTGVTQRVILIAFDAQGNVILTPDTFTTAVTLAFNNVGPAAEQAIIQAVVTYANPVGGIVSAHTSNIDPSITVNSPNDVINVSAVGSSPALNTNVALFAFVGPAPATLPSAIPSAPTNGTPAASAGLAFQVNAQPATQPAPVNVLSWGASPSTGLVVGDGSNPTYTFASALSPLVNLSVSESLGGNPVTGSVTINSSDCSSSAFDQPMGGFPTVSPITIALNGPTFILETTAHDGVSPVPNPDPSASPAAPFPVTGVTCHITAKDPVTLATSTLTVFVNNASGLTVQ